MLENDSIHAGAQTINQLGVVLERQPLGRRQERYFDVDVPELVGRERLEARVLERRSAGVLGDVLRERPLGLERTDAAAQLTTLRQGDEARARFAQPGLLGDRRAGLCAYSQRGGDRLTRDLQQLSSVLCPVARAFGCERKGGVADDPVLVAGGVARVAAVEQPRRESFALGRDQHAGHRRRPAGLLVTDCGVEAENRLHGGAVDLARGLVRMVVREVRADHDQRFGSAPDALQHVGDFLRSGVAHHQRHQRESVQDLLQERQLHFERVLFGVRRRRFHDLGQAADRGDRLFVQRDPAKGRVECARPRQREAVHGNPVTGTEDHDASDDAARRAQLIVGARRDRSGIDKTGVRDDHRLGESRRERRLLGLVEIGSDFFGEHARVRRVEQARDRGRAHFGVTEGVHALNIEHGPPGPKPRACAFSVAAMRGAGQSRARAGRGSAPRPSWRPRPRSPRTPAAGPCGAARSGPARPAPPSP